MLLINCEITFMLTWSVNSIITNSTGTGAFEITDTKLYVPVVTLSTLGYDSSGQCGWMVDGWGSNSVVVGSNPVTVTYTSDILPVSSKSFLTFNQL